MSGSKPPKSLTWWVAVISAALGLAGVFLSFRFLVRQTPGSGLIFAVSIALLVIAAVFGAIMYLKQRRSPDGAA
ncbi:hypothetical protein ASF23_05755 [Curtobacterium sp. Leaf261]|nr:hypothetical protein ASF23_05755 [Curtobacterium sp. Leaf261]